MCMMKSPSAPPPPPPPPAAPPMLEQEAPKLSEASDESEMITAKSQGLSSYKVDRRNQHFAGNNPLSIRGGTGIGNNN